MKTKYQAVVCLVIAVASYSVMSAGFPFSFWGKDTEFTGLWYIDSYATNDVGRLEDPDDTSSGTVVHYMGGTNFGTGGGPGEAWTNLYTIRIYTNIGFQLLYADAMTEYEAGTNIITNPVGLGTNWVFDLSAWNHLSSTNVDSWTNLYVSTGY